MTYFNVISGLFLLVILQVMVIPFNIGFLGLFTISLFSEKLSYFILLGVLTGLISIFGNLNPGLVLIILTFSFLVLSFLRNILPENNFSRGILIIAAVPLCELVTSFFSQVKI